MNIYQSVKYLLSPAKLLSGSWNTMDISIVKVKIYIEFFRYSKVNNISTHYKLVKLSYNKNFCLKKGSKITCGNGPISGRVSGTSTVLFTIWINWTKQLFPRLFTKTKVKEMIKSSIELVNYFYHEKNKVIISFIKKYNWIMAAHA